MIINFKVCFLLLYFILPLSHTQFLAFLCLLFCVGVPASVKVAIDRERKSADLMGYYEMRNVASVCQLLVKRYLHKAMIAHQLVNNAASTDEIKSRASIEHARWMFEAQQANDLHLRYQHMTTEPFRRILPSSTSAMPPYHDSSSTQEQSSSTTSTSSSSEGARQDGKLPELSAQQLWQLGYQLLKIPANRDDALKYIERAADGGILDAQYIMALQYRPRDQHHINSSHIDGSVASSTGAPLPANITASFSRPPRHSGNRLLGWAMAAFTNRNDPKYLHVDRQRMDLELNFIIGSLYMGGEPLGISPSSTPSTATAAPAATPTNGPTSPTTSPSSILASPTNGMSVNPDFIKAEHHLREAVRNGDLSRAGHWLAQLLWRSRGSNDENARNEAITIWQNSSYAGGYERHDITEEARNEAVEASARSSLILAQHASTATSEKLVHYRRALELLMTLRKDHHVHKEQVPKLKEHIESLNRALEPENVH
jgi:hypothetical protein